MTTFDEILAFVKEQARISTSSLDATLTTAINMSYMRFCRKGFWPPLRVTGTPFALTGGTQDYALPANFMKFVTDSVFLYTTGTTDFQALEIETDPNASIYDSMDTQSDPIACMVIPGSTGIAKKIRLLPNFSTTGRFVKYNYYKLPTTLSAGLTPETPELCDAIAWDVLASNKDYGRDSDTSQEMYLQRSKSAWRDAKGIWGL